MIFRFNLTFLQYLHQRYLILQAVSSSARSNSEAEQFRQLPLTSDVTCWCEPMYHCTMPCLVRSSGHLVRKFGCGSPLVSEDILPRPRDHLTHVHFQAPALKAEVIPLDDWHDHIILVDTLQTRLATGTTRKPFLTKHRLQLSLGCPGSVRWQQR